METEMEHIMECWGILIEWRNKVKMEDLQSEEKRKMQRIIEYYQNGNNRKERKRKLRNLSCSLDDISVPYTYDYKLSQQRGHNTRNATL